MLDLQTGTPVASQAEFVSHANATRRQRLRDLIGEIHSTFDRNASQLQKARLILEAKRRVEAGDAGAGVRWSDWYREHLKLHPSTICNHLKIARAGDSAAALNLARARQNSRQERHRANKLTVKEPERRALIVRILELDAEGVRKLSEIAATL
jgi:hypothetical protein